MSDVSAVVNYFPTVNEGFTTTCGGTIAPAATTVPLNSVSGLTNATTFVGIIEPGGTNQQVFTGTVDTGGSQITGVKWTRGTNVTHASGVTIVDYSTGTAINMISAGILKEHLSTGVHALTANSTITSSKHITAINDTNGNELFKLTPTASAVNEITVANAATGNSASLAATGGDTNLDFLLTPKGSGLLKVGAVPLQQTAWISYTPTWTNLTIGNAVVVARYRQMGKKVDFTVDVTLGTTTVVSSTVYISLPVAMRTVGQHMPLGKVMLIDAGVASYTGMLAYDTGTDRGIIYTYFTGGGVGTGIGVSGIGGLVPFTWGTSDKIMIYGSYEVS
jgi:hypothetical protein